MGKVTLVISVVVIASVASTNSKPALGKVVTIEVEGVVTEVQTYDGLEFDDSVTVGSTMIGSSSYDTETPDQYQSEDSGLYSLISISMNVGNYTFIGISTVAGDPSFHIRVGHGFWYNVNSPGALYYGPCYLNGKPTNLEDVVSEVGFQLMFLQGDNDGTITDALPDEGTFPDLSIWTEWKSFRAESWLTPSFTIAGEVTSVRFVPEPATILLFGLGGLALIRKRRV